MSINCTAPHKLKRFPAKACPGLDPGWIPARVKKTDQNKKIEPPFRFHRNGKGLWIGSDPPAVTTALFVDLTQAARSPGSAATRANRAAYADRAADANRATTEPKSTQPAAAATRAAATATEPETAAATTEPAAATTAAATAAAAASATASAGHLHAAANVFLIENIERGETDVGHFLLAQNEALIGRDTVRLRDAGSGHRGCGCIARQRKTQSGGTQHLHGGCFGPAFLLRSLLDP
jgi:hypothetical protein